MVLPLKSLEIWRAISFTRFSICSSERTTLGYLDWRYPDGAPFTPLPQFSFSSPRSEQLHRNCWQNLAGQGTLASRRSAQNSQSPASSSVRRKKILFPDGRVATTLLLSLGIGYMPEKICPPHANF